GEVRQRPPLRQRRHDDGHAEVHELLRLRRAQPGRRGAGGEVVGGLGRRGGFSGGVRRDRLGGVGGAGGEDDRQEEQAHGAGWVGLPADGRPLSCQTIRIWERRNASTLACTSPWNRALAATSTSAPASATARAFCGVTPPSTSIRAREPVPWSSARARRSLSVVAGM